MERYQEGRLTPNNNNKERELLKKIAQLEQKVGQQTLEIDLLKKAKKIVEQRKREELLKKPITGASYGGAK